MPRYARLKTWSGRIASFLWREFSIQALTFLSGLLIVRSLDKSEYALYTVVMSMQSTFAVLFDSGLSSGIFAIGGQFHHDRHKLGALLNSAFALRDAICISALALASPLLVWILMRNHASPSFNIAANLIVVLGVYYQLSNSLTSQLRRLLLDTTGLQQLLLLVAAVRLLGVALIRLFAPVALAAVLVNAAVAVFQFFQARKWYVGEVESTVPPSPEMSGKLRRLMLRQAPSSLYYSIQGQIGIWLLSFFSNVGSVADIGALGRFSMVFAVLNSLVANLAFPRFSRLPADKSVALHYAGILAFYVFPGLCILAVASAKPGVFLWILGSRYSGLTAELPLALLGFILNGIGGTMWSLNLARGWILNPFINVSFNGLVQVILIYTLDVHKLSGVLEISVFSGLAASCLIGGYAVVKMSSGRGKQRTGAAP
jgi:O-antigen/teichoic acid export membrane protein